MKQLFALALLMIQNCLGLEPAPISEASGGQRPVDAPAYQRTVVSLDAIRSAHGADEFGRPLALPDPLELRQLLLEGSFERLEADLASLEAAHAADPRKELWVDAAYWAFHLPDPALREPLERWLARYPESHRPLIARGEYAFALAWHIRGTAYVSKTAPERLAAMRPLLERAAADFRAALERSPDALQAHIRALDVERARGDREAEEAAFERASAIHPESFLLRRHHMLALLPRWGGSFSQMEEFAHQSVAEVPGRPEMKMLLGYRWSEQARIVIDASPERAEAFAEAALGYGPYWVFFAMRGDARIARGNTQGALADFDAAVALFPLDPRALANRAHLLVVLGRMEEAFATIDRALALAPTDERWRSWHERQAAHLIRAGWERAQEGDLAGALTLYDRAEILDPELPLLHLHRGRAHGWLNEFEPARRDFERAIALDPDNFEAYSNMDALLVRRRLWGDIVGYWDRFLGRQPGHAEAYLWRGGAHFQADDMERALADFERACSLGNQNACGRLEDPRS